MRDPLLSLDTLSLGSVFVSHSWVFPGTVCVRLLWVRAEPLEVISRTVKQGQLNMGDNS